MTQAQDRTIRSIAVLGGGIVGLSAAMAFARALPNARITVIALPSDPAALADRMPGTLPAIGRFHAAIGIDEIELVRAGAATHRLGTRFENWSADGKTWFHCFGEHGAPAGAIPFHQLWLRARRANNAAPYDQYSAAAALAGSGKFVHPEDGTGSPLSTYLYALRLDPKRYAGHLAERAKALALHRMEGELNGVERREDGGIAAVLMKDGSRIEAELFVDCGGPEAPLLSAIDEQFEPWAEWLPCDRILIGEGEPPASPGSCDVASASTSGWRWTSPLPDRTMTGFAYCSAITGDEDAARELPAEAGHGDAERVTIRPGRRPRPWQHNVLALGDAAIAVDPLESTNLNLAHDGILLALELLPGRDFNSVGLAEYNRRMDELTVRLRDFLALHYLACPRRSGDFWKSMEGRSRPASLERTLRQFRRRGRFPFFEEETFGKQSWIAVLIGMGVLPRHVDPAAAAVDPEEAAAGMARMRDAISGVVPRLPSYRDYLTRMTRAPVR